MKRETRIRRIYDPVLDDDGARVLVDRLWPRGISKERAELTQWCKTVAPSTELRKWYAHVPERFEEFSERYRDELGDDERVAALGRLRELRDEHGALTLLTATKRPEISEAAVLLEVLED